MQVYSERSALRFHKMSACTIYDLPQEMLIEILSYLTVEELIINAQYVCKKWKTVLEDALLWESLTFAPGNRISDFVMLHLLKKMPKLKNFCPRRIISMNIPVESSDGSNVTANSYHVIEFLSEHCKTIKKIHFDSNQTIRPQHIKTLLESLPNLESLSVNLGVNVNNVRRSMGLISKCHHLKSLTISKSYPEIPGLFKVVAKGCRALRHLKIGKFEENNPINPSDLLYILQHKRNALVSLSFVCKQLNDKILYLLKECAYLKNLQCVISTSSQAAFCSLGQIKSLKLFSLQNFEDKSTMLHTMFSHSRFSNLQKLYLSCYLFSGYNELIILIFEKCLLLTDLVIEVPSAEVLGKELQCIRKARNLRRFHLSGCRHITEEAMEYISSCEKLSYLGLVGCKYLTDNCINSLVKIQQLQKLVLDYSHGITGKNFHLIPECLPHLIYLSIMYCPTLDVANAQQLVTDMPSLYFQYCK